MTATSLTSPSPTGDSPASSSPLQQLAQASPANLEAIADGGLNVSQGVALPGAGLRSVVPASLGTTYAFPTADVAFSQEGPSLVVSSDQGEVVLEDFFVLADSGLPPALSLADGTVVTVEDAIAAIPGFDADAIATAAGGGAGGGGGGAAFGAYDPGSLGDGLDQSDLGGDLDLGLAGPAATADEFTDTTPVEEAEPEIVGSGAFIDGEFNAALVFGDAAPWSQQYSYDASMNTAFGQGNWDQVYQARNGENVFNMGYDFLWIDGGNGQTAWFDSFVEQFRDEMETYVESGGTLLLNAGRWYGESPLDLGFGAQLAYEFYEYDVRLTEAGQDLIGDGLASTYSGTYFSHDGILDQDGDLSALIVGLSEQQSLVLAEQDYGAGHVVLGGMTAAHFHQPSGDAFELEANILEHAASHAADYPVV
ncbi:hypothetical protein [Roseospirillum parvum]|uniref:Uncharacterized protein n=1 Tax=Roseospirillum parvum TaxID=83401 RepID=A0A1G7XSB1_9PROT|nr:hypothetical protein [Roseospirillum parvum]SDG86996.1 hypothetical protein SAMN05421742_10377 [Roseospirillum parvum]